MDSAGNMGSTYVDANLNSNNDNQDDSRRIALLVEEATRERPAARTGAYLGYVTTSNTRGPRLHNNVFHRRIRLNSVGEESISDDE